uniref:Pre-mRNA-splicing factor 3 domain-containing protein n=1 Tax=Daucus carota subsp. sativus TaxID=79200 RepID=A0A175YN39_DAUCS
MDKPSEKDKSSRRHKDPDRDRDHHHKHRSSKHKSRDDDDKHRSRGDRENDRERRERSYESRDERERSRERVLDVNLSKRKERGGSEEERFDEKRARVSDERRERKRFEDVNGEERIERDEREERRERKRIEDGEERGKRKERRRFGDKVKEEDVDVDSESKRGSFDEVLVKREVKNEEVNGNQNGAGGSVANGAGSEPLNMASGTLPGASFTPVDNPKVSSIYTTNENKGVIVNRSYEVPGKSSTDGTTPAAGRSGGLHSLDALTKARITLQKQKEISEKLKKIPLLNKSIGSKEGSKAAVSTSGILPTPAPSAGVTLSSSILPTSASAKPLVSGVPHLEGLTAPKVEAVKRAQELAAKMGFRQDPQYAPLINMFPGQLPPDVTVQPKPAKAPVLRLDALGREIDEHGNVVNVPKLNNLSTLKLS